MARDIFGNAVDGLDEADRLADRVYAHAPVESDDEQLAIALRELISEVRTLRHRIALLDGGDGMT